MKNYLSSLHGNVCASNDSNLYYQLPQHYYSYVTEDEQRIIDEQVAIYIVLAYCELNNGTQWNYDVIMDYCNLALQLDDANTCVYRCMGIANWKKASFDSSSQCLMRSGGVRVAKQGITTLDEETQSQRLLELKTESVKYFNMSLSFCGYKNRPANTFDENCNPYTLRQCSLVCALQGNYPTALELMRVATTLVDIANPAAWRTLGIMHYLYSGKVDQSSAEIALGYLM